MGNVIRQIAERVYISSGIRAVPLVYDSKVPMFKGVYEGDCLDQWKRVGDRRANIGQHLGQGNVALDADNAQTVQRYQAWLAELGIDLPTCDTAGKGKHFSCRSDTPKGFNIALLRPDFGSGEVRSGNSLKVLPPSWAFSQKTQQSGRYKQASGSLIDYARAIANAPFVPFCELQKITSKPKTQAYTLPPIVFARADPDWHRIERYFSAIKGSEKGRALVIDEKKYLSRSEAEAAIMGELVRAGYFLDETLDIFKQNNCGHFAEKTDHTGFNYLQDLYLDSLWFSTQLEYRAWIADCYQLVLNSTQIGGVDRIVLLALYQVGLKANRTTFKTSMRALRQMTGLALDSIVKALEALQGGFIELKNDTYSLSTQITLLTPPLNLQESNIRVTVFNANLADPAGNSPTSRPVDETTTTTPTPACEISHKKPACNLWVWSLLSQKICGGIAGNSYTIERVYYQLGTEAKNARQIAESLDLDYRTVFTQLEHLRAHGLAHRTDQRATKPKSTWGRGERSLDAVALDLGFHTAFTETQRQIEIERQQQLEMRGKNSKSTTIEH